jgi:hypothetical protein
MQKTKGYFKTSLGNHAFTQLEFTQEVTELPCVKFSDGIETYYLFGNENEIQLSDLKSGKKISGNFQKVKNFSWEEIFSLFYSKSKKTLQEIYENIHLYYLKMNISNDIRQNNINEKKAFEIMLLHEEQPNLIIALQKSYSSIILLESRLKLVLYLLALSDMCFQTQHIKGMKMSFDKSTLSVDLEDNHKLIIDYILSLETV